MESLKNKWFILWVFVASCLALVVLALLLNILPVRSVKVKGSYLYVDQHTIETALQDAVPQSMLAFSLNDFKSAITTVPWVKTVSVRRLWPDALLVYFEEYEPFANWCLKGYLSKEGVLIKSTLVHGERLNLPLTFCGPEGSEGIVLSQYDQFNKIIAPLGLSIRSLQLSDRYAWQMVLSNHLLINLGHENINRRLRNLIVHWRALEHVIPAAAVIDLRYPNGIAIRGQFEETDDA